MFLRTHTRIHEGNEMHLYMWVQTAYIISDHSLA